jgi:hypothetical protein
VANDWVFQSNARTTKHRTGFAGNFKSHANVVLLSNTDLLWTK